MAHKSQKHHKNANLSGFPYFSIGNRSFYKGVTTYFCSCTNKSLAGPRQASQRHQQKHSDNAQISKDIENSPTNFTLHVSHNINKPREPTTRLGGPELGKKSDVGLAGRPVHFLTIICKTGKARSFVQIY